MRWRRLIVVILVLCVAVDKLPATGLPRSLQFKQSLRANLSQTEAMSARLVSGFSNLLRPVRLTYSEYRQGATFLRAGTDLTFWQAWLFPFQSRTAILQWIGSSLILMLPFYHGHALYGLFWNIGYRAVMGRQLMNGEAPLPNWDVPDHLLLKYGKMIARGVLFFVILPAALLALPAWWAHSRALWIAAEICLAVCVHAFPALVIPYRRALKQGELFLPQFAHLAVLLHLSYWKAWAILWPGFAAAFFMIPSIIKFFIPSIIGFFFVSAWLCEMISYCFALVYLPAMYRIDKSLTFTSDDFPTHRPQTLADSHVLYDGLVRYCDFLPSPEVEELFNFIGPKSLRRKLREMTNDLVIGANIGAAGRPVHFKITHYPDQNLVEMQAHQDSITHLDWEALKTNAKRYGDEGFAYFTIPNKPIRHLEGAITTEGGLFRNFIKFDAAALRFSRMMDGSMLTVFSHFLKPSVPYVARRTPVGLAA